MSLSHDFYLIDASKEESRGEKVSISDDIYFYVQDSFQWFESYWLNQGTKIGLNYYGESEISGENIVKLINILEGWINLLMNAPENFKLTGEFNLNEERFELINYKKKEIIGSLSELKKLCEDADRNGTGIFYWGI